jgi:uncharacterized protein YbjT (DUF2867 family)
VQSTIRIRKTVLVTGATGRQGGALARLLLARGHRVRAFTRRPQSARALALQARGADIAPGCFDDRWSVMTAVEGVDALFATTSATEAGTDAEVGHGRVLAEVARELRAPHVVYASKGGGTRLLGMAQLDGKVRVERLFDQLEVPTTVLGVALFMSSLHETALARGLADGVLELGLPAERVVPLVTVEDAARFTADVIERPRAFLGRRIEVASDAVSGWRMAEILSAHLGRSIVYRAPALRRAEDAAHGSRLSAWLSLVGHSADVPGLRALCPSARWHRFEEWVGAQDWSWLARPAVSD